VVIFKQEGKDQSFTVLAKFEKTEQKAKTTAVERKEVDGVQRVVSIAIGGSDEKLVFAN
jgi:VCBS repeat-containing protein